VFSGCARPAAPPHDARRTTGIEAAMTAAALAEGGDLDGARRIMAGRAAETGSAGRAGTPADLAGRARTGPGRGPTKP
jgi:hypothetical protein